MTDETKVEKVMAIEDDEQGRSRYRTTFSFKIPKTHILHLDKNGKIREVTKTFDFSECKNDAQASATLIEEEWALVDMVNDELKSRAKNNAYQRALAPYKTNPKVTKEMIRSRMVLDMIRYGVAEDVAEKTVATLPV